MLLLSGDQEGTLIVPCPPYKYAITRGAPGAVNESKRSITLLYEGCSAGSIVGGNEMIVIHFPSGEICGNQLLYSSNVNCSLPVPSGFIRHICIVPVGLAL